MPPRLSSKWYQGKHILHINALWSRTLWLTDLRVGCCHTAVLSALGFFKHLHDEMRQTNRSLLWWYESLFAASSVSQHSAHILKGTLNKMYLSLLYRQSGNPSFLQQTLVSLTNQKYLTKEADIEWFKIDRSNSRIKSNFFIVRVGGHEWQIILNSLDFFSSSLWV